MMPVVKKLPSLSLICSVFGQTNVDKTYAEGHVYSIEVQG